MWCNVGFADVVRWDCKHWNLKFINFEIDTEKKVLRGWGANKDNSTFNESYSIISMDDEKVVVKQGSYPSWEWYYGTNQSAYVTSDSAWVHYDCKKVKGEIAKKPKEKKPEKEQPPKPKLDDKKLIIIGSGSGFFVSDQGHIVSNEHVVGVCKKVSAYEEGREVTLNILATDMVNDIGLVKGQFNNKQYLNIKTDGAELGEDIVAFGYPLSQDLSDSVKLTKGIVSSLTGLGNNISQIQIDAAIQPGNSGGPVVNMNSQVVGIASAGLSKLYMAQKAAYIPENVNFAVASQTLTAFLKANKINIGTSASKVMSTKELAKIGEPVTLQLFCYNTEAAYAKLKKADKHSDVLLDLN
jgi:S1-C subfamily serine protease